VSNHESGTARTSFPQPGPAERRFWPEGWWRLMEFRIGVIPLPVYVITVAVLAYFQLRDRLPTEINVAIAVLAIGGYSCAELGKRLPLIGRMGGGAIFATFIPSVLVYYKILPATLVSAVTAIAISRATAAFSRASTRSCKPLRRMCYPRRR
jgi:malate:Na+ symporter